MGSFVEEVTPELGFEGEVGFDRDGGKGSLGRECRMRKLRKETRGCLHRGWGVDQLARGCVGAMKDTPGKICWGQVRKGLECQAKGITFLGGFSGGPLRS